MEDKMKEIIALRDERLEEAKRETDEKFRFAGFCAVSAINRVLTILGYEEAEEEISDEDFDALLDALKEEE